MVISSNLAWLFWNAGHVTGTTGFVTLLVVGDLHILAGDGRTCRSGFT